MNLTINFESIIQIIFTINRKNFSRIDLNMSQVCLLGVCNLIKNKQKIFTIKRGKYEYL